MFSCGLFNRCSRCHLAASKGRVKAATTLSINVPVLALSALQAGLHATSASSLYFSQCKSSLSYKHSATLCKVACVWAACLLIRWTIMWHGEVILCGRGWGYNGLSLNLGFVSWEVLLPEYCCASMSWWVPCACCYAWCFWCPYVEYSLLEMLL